MPAASTMPLPVLHYKLHAIWRALIELMDITADSGLCLALVITLTMLQNATGEWGDPKDAWNSRGL
jgi:hypothetical protein